MLGSERQAPNRKPHVSFASSIASASWHALSMHFVAEVDVQHCYQEVLLQFLTDVVPAT